MAGAVLESTENEFALISLEHDSTGNGDLIGRLGTDFQLSVAKSNGVECVGAIKTVRVRVDAAIAETIELLYAPYSLCGDSTYALLRLVVELIRSIHRCKTSRDRG
jgi:hypothetical protein